MRLLCLGEIIKRVDAEFQRDYPARVQRDAGFRQALLRERIVKYLQEPRVCSLRSGLGGVRHARSVSRSLKVNLLGQEFCVKTNRNIKVPSAQTVM